MEGCMRRDCMRQREKAESGLDAHLILLHVISCTILIAD